jgi:hypothetical protein
MQIVLDSAQTAELAKRGSDVDDMLSILVGERRSDDVVAAHDQLVIADLSRRADRIVSMHGAEEIHAFVKDYVGQTSTDAEDPDVLKLTGIMGCGEDDVTLGVMRRHGSEDMGLVEAVADRFDLELPEDFERSCRRANLITMLKVGIEDEDGFAC